ncbi:MAG: endolytic transglycosylase MltG [Thermomonas sp.]
MSRRSSKASGGALKRFLVLLLVVAIAAGAWTWQRYQGFANAPLIGVEAGDSLLVARGDSLESVLRTLQAGGVRTGEPLQWKLLARKLGAAGKLQVGEYALKPGIDPQQLLVAMRDGKVVRRKFTIVEGWNIRELRTALAKVELLEHASKDMDDAALMRALEHAGEHPEGRFLPETYAWVRGDTDLNVLRRAYQAMDKALDAAWTSRVEGLPLNSKNEVLTLASIIEKETGIAEERPAIAGVFVRRIKVGMRLQTDPTVIYGMGAAYAGNIRRSDLTTDTPYNTYTRDGLPPTPIAMPGVAALRAATHPADGDALYFVAVGDGSGRHVFTRSLAEHQDAVRDYLQRYRAQQQVAPK